jgi:hypothetical protein
LCKQCLVESEAERSGETTPLSEDTAQGDVCDRWWGTRGKSQRLRSTIMMTTINEVLM